MTCDDTDEFSKACEYILSISRYYPYNLIIYFLQRGGIDSKIQNAIPMHLKMINLNVWGFKKAAHRKPTINHTILIKFEGKTRAWTEAPSAVTP